MRTMTTLMRPPRSVWFGSTARAVAVAGLLVAWPSQLGADSCSAAPPIVLQAACGRTVMGVGWNQPIPSEMLALIVPHVRLQLVDERGFVAAETESDFLGQFAFPTVPAGSYALSAKDELWAFNREIRISHPSGDCARSLYVYLSPGHGWPCRARLAERSRPAELIR
jgi:hypothetical protein